MKTICWLAQKPNTDILSCDWSYSLATQLAGEEAGQWGHRNRLRQPKLSVHWLTDGRHLSKQDQLKATMLWLTC